MAAVRAATPSLPFGSDAGPALNSKRKLTSGEEFGRSTLAIFGEPFPARATGAATANTKMIAINTTRLLLSCILRVLLVRQRHDGAVTVDKILPGHRLDVFGRDRGVEIVNLVQRLRRAAQRDIRRKARCDGFRIVHAERKAVFQIRLHR